MIQRILGCAAMSAFMIVATGSLQAHHSLAGVYEMHKDVELTGTVASVKFTNPHGALTVTVKNQDGTTSDWVLTLGSATALAQRGVGKTGPNALHEGDKVTVKFLPAKDGAPLGFLKTVTYADGHTIVISAGNAND